MEDIEIFKDLNITEKSRKNLNDCRKSNKFTDLILKSNDEQEMNVHKSVLWSSCTYFESMLNADFKECQASSIHLKNIKMMDLEVIIEYLYTGEAKIPKKRSTLIYEKANYFQLVELQEFCGSLLLQEIDDENCLQLLRYADLFCDDNLKRGSIKYFAKNGNNLLEKYLTEFSNDEFDAIISDAELKICPDKMFTCVMNWIKLDLRTRSSHFETLLKNVDLLTISDDFMDETLLNCKLFSSELLKMLIESLRKLKSSNNLVSHIKDNITVVVNRESPNIALSDALEMVSHFLVSSHDNIPINIQQHAVLPQPSRQPIRPIRSTRESRLLRRLATDSTLKISNSVKSQPSTSRREPRLVFPNKNQKRIFVAYNYSIEKLNLEKNIWEQQYLYSADKFNYAIASNKNNIYLIGGITSKSEPSSVVHVYNQNIKRNIRIPSMLEGRKFHKSICLHDKIYACGGETNSGSMEYFDIGREIWIKGPLMKKSRNCFGLCTNGATIYAVGGTEDQTIESFDPRQGEWNLLGKVPSSYYKCKSFCLNNDTLYTVDPTSGGFVYDLRILKIKEEIFPDFDIREENISWNRYDVIEFEGKVYGIFRNQLYQYDELAWKNLRPSYLKHSIESINLCIV